MATFLPHGKHSSELKAAVDSLAQVATLPFVTPVLTALQSVGSFLVGGVVRDSLLQKKVVDIDLTTQATPEIVTNLLSAAGIHVVPTGLKHGTVTAVVDGNHVEVTTFRKRSANGEMVFGADLETDLLLRDFTINAIAYDPIAKKLIDPAGGFEDITTKQLRAVKDPVARFEEDPLRILRLVRFGPAAGLSVDAQTEQAAQVVLPKLNKISPERIRDELKKIIMSPKAGNGFRYLAGLGALDFTIPELIPSIGCEQNSWHLYDVFEHTMHVLDNAPFDLIVRLAALFHDIGKPGTVSVGDDGERHFYKHELLSQDLCKVAMTRLKFSTDEINNVSLLVALHMRPIECGAPGARRLIRDLGDKFSTWVDLKRADAYGAKHDRAEFEGRMKSFIDLTEKERVRLVTNRGRVINIDGAELMTALQIKPSPVVGKILKALEERVLDTPELNTKEQLLNIARELLKQSS